MSRTRAGTSSALCCSLRAATIAGNDESGKDPAGSSRDYTGVLSFGVENDFILDSDDNYTSSVGIGWTSNEAERYQRRTFVPAVVRAVSFLPVSAEVFNAAEDSKTAPTPRRQDGSKERSDLTNLCPGRVIKWLLISNLACLARLIRKDHERVSIPLVGSIQSTTYAGPQIGAPSTVTVT